MKTHGYLTLCVGFAVGCSGGDFNTGVEFRAVPDAASFADSATAHEDGGGAEPERADAEAAGGRRARDVAGGATSAGGAASGGHPTGGGGGGAVGTGGNLGTGGSCSPSACANDNATCGEIADGCGGVSRCLHQCGNGETCDTTTHRCACTATDKCPKTLKNGESFGACCTQTGACGEDLGSYGCGAFYSCTFIGTGGCGESPLGGGMPTWACPGLDVGPDPSCTRIQGSPSTGQTHFCCLKSSYP